MSLYLKYRPVDLDEVRGNEDTVAALNKMLVDSKCPHALLFIGETGCGKTTLARIVASRLSCRGTDYVEQDSASYRGIDSVRELRQQSRFKPMNGRCRVYVLDEVHKMTNDAQNAMLKELEDTPRHVYYILCTTDPQKLLPTIKGRCVTFTVQLLNDGQMRKLLHQVVRLEHAELADETYDQIIQDALGHPRNALQVLEQVLTLPAERQLEAARQASVIQSESIALCRALIDRASWTKVRQVLSGLKDQEPETVRRHVMAYCTTTLLKGENDQAGLIMEEMVEPFYNNGFSQLVYSCYRVCKQ